MRELSDEQKRVLLEKGTEAPFSGTYVHTKDHGMYRCAQCGTQLFSSDTKFDSGTGWPSFDSALSGAVAHREDNAHGMQRTEVVCAKCGGHLGHVFDDGPTDPSIGSGQATGKRYCINSVCLELEKE